MQSTASGVVEDERPRLIAEIRRCEANIEGLLPKAQQLRARHHQMYHGLAKRLEDLEAHFFTAQLEPVDHGTETHHHHLPPEESQRPPLGLQASFAKQAHVLRAEEEKRREQDLIGWLDDVAPLPPLPWGSKVVQARVVDGPDADFERPPGLWPWEQALMPPPKPPAPPPRAQGRIVDANAVLMPSPCHPIGQYRQMGFCENLYPVTPPPFPHLHYGVLNTPYPRANERHYEAPVDFFNARGCPPMWWQSVPDESDLGRIASERWSCDGPRPPWWEMPPQAPLPGKVERALASACSQVFPD